jgi:hypothetical protein
MILIGSIGGFFDKFRAKLERDLVVGGIELLDAQRFDQQAQAMRGEQRLALQRQFAEAVDQFFLQGIDIFGAFAVGQALVQRQAFMDIGAVGVGQQGRGAQVDFGTDAQRLGQIDGVQVPCLASGGRRRG